MKFSPKNILVFYKNLIWEARFWILALLCIFGLGVLCGLTISLTTPNFSKLLLKNYAESVDFGVSGFNLSWIIFERNFGIVVFASFFGAILGIVPTLITVVNGLLLGVVLGFRDIYQSVNPWQLLWLLLPHGIFEYSATFLGLAFGLRLGLNWLISRNVQNRREIFKADFKKLLLILPIITLLLFIAALIEGILTLPIACLIAGVCR